MALKDKRKKLIDYIASHDQYLKNNHELFLIHEGQIRPFVAKVMQESLSPQYYKQIKKRILDINIIPKFIEKVSQVYSTDPMRTTYPESFHEITEEYEQALDINVNGMLADKWANLFKGFAWEIFLHKGTPRLRALPFDRFLVYTEDQVDPLSEDIFIKFLGKRTIEVQGRQVEKEVFFAYSNTEFDAFTQDGDSYVTDEILETEGVNPYGVIPFVYGNRSYTDLIPIQDTDMRTMAVQPAVGFSDLAGVSLFQCFSIVYGIDVVPENITMSPNSFWNIKSDDKTIKNATIGTIKPEADIDQVMRFYTAMISLWLETKGARVGSIGSVDADNAQNGISKIIDEMDTYKIVKKSINFFKKDEKELWEKIKVINNYWVQQGMVDTQVFKLLPNDFYVETIFDEPMPIKSLSEKIAESKAELELGTTTLDIEIKKLHPDYDDDTVEKIMGENNTEIIMNDNQGEDDGQSAEGNN